MPDHAPPRTPARRGRRRRTTLGLAAALFGLVVGLVAPIAPASAAPGDEEGGTAELREQLDAASKGFLDAKAALAKSVERQKELTANLGGIETELAARNQALGELAHAAYRTGRLGPMTALLNADSPEGLLDRVVALDMVAANENRELRALADVKEREAAAKAALDREVLEQRKQVATMEARRNQAEKALDAAEARQAAAARAAARAAAARASVETRDTGAGGTAKPAPRNPDGSWPAESCSVNDPTPANGCITPRMLHALNQAKAAGFTRYVSCYRSGGSGEHPKGRACDFAAQKSGFGGDAAGGDKTYGTNLANYFIRNADGLGVLYVIWYRRIWLPSSGWKSYSGAGGDPSSDHTNHVHLSVY